MKLDEVRVSKIIANSCQTRPSFNTMAHDIWFNKLHLDVFDGVSRFISGSSSEFFIEPPISEIGDFDYMDSRKDELVVFEEVHGTGFEADVNLACCIQIFNLEKNSCPSGYYNLRGQGKLMYNWLDGRYDHFEGQQNCYQDLLLISSDTVEIGGKITVSPDEWSLHFEAKGPAIKHKLSFIPFARSAPWARGCTTSDNVYAIRCLAWPPDAQLWLCRERKSAWPCLGTKSEVMNNGCDFVHVAHKDSKYDQLQWRISFSRAEVILIRSWIPTQQIVYHMVRYFLKQELLRKGIFKITMRFCPDTT